MRILLTGATGFVGTTLLKRLVNDGQHQICCLGRNIDRIDAKVDKIDCTLPNWDEYVVAWKPEIVLHLAAAFTGRSRFEDIDNLVNSNILFTAQIAEAVTRAGSCKAFINCGTFTEFLHGAGTPQPNNLYSATKAAARPILQYYQSVGGWRWINVIVYSPYGRHNPHKKVLDYLLDALGSKKPVDFSPGQQTLDFIHVDDMADFFVTLTNKINQLPQGYTQLHLGTGVGHTLRDAAQLMQKISNLKVNANWGGRHYNPADPMHAVAPISATLKYLDWQPSLSFEEGLKILINDCKTS